MIRLAATLIALIITFSASLCAAQEKAAETLPICRVLSQAQALLDSTGFVSVASWNNIETGYGRNILRAKEGADWAYASVQDAEGGGEKLFCFMLHGAGNGFVRPQAYDKVFDGVTLPCPEQVKLMRAKPYVTPRSVSASTVGATADGVDKAIAGIAELAKANGWSASKTAEQRAALLSFRTAIGAPPANFCAHGRAIPLADALRPLANWGGSNYRVELLGPVAVAPPYPLWRNVASFVLLVEQTPQEAVIGRAVIAFAITKANEAIVAGSGIKFSGLAAPDR